MLMLPVQFLLLSVCALTDDFAKMSCVNNVLDRFLDVYPVIRVSNLRPGMFCRGLGTDCFVRHPVSWLYEIFRALALIIIHVVESKMIFLWFVCGRGGL